MNVKYNVYDYTQKSLRQETMYLGQFDALIDLILRESSRKRDARARQKAEMEEKRKEEKTLKVESESGK